MKIVFNHRITISSDVQPFEKLSNFQSLNFLIPSSKNHCCYISLFLKITNGYRYRLLAEIYSIIIVYLRRPRSFLKVLYFSAIPSIKPLALILYIKPVSSIFHRSAYIIFFNNRQVEKRKLYLDYLNSSPIDTNGIYITSLKGSDV